MFALYNVGRALKTIDKTIITIKERIKYVENKISSIREHKEQNKHLFKETDLIAHSVELNRLKDELK